MRHTVAALGGAAVLPASREENELVPIVGGVIKILVSGRGPGESDHRRKAPLRRPEVGRLIG